MSESKHTPGPWTVRDDEDAIRIRAEAEYLTVALMPKDTIGDFPDHPEAMAAALADARLVAAAPDLRAACEEWADALAGGAALGLNEREVGMLRRARAAVARARGR